jgi:hypothetical protein
LRIEVGVIGDSLIEFDAGDVTSTTTAIGSQVVLVGVEGDLVLELVVVGFLNFLEFFFGSGSNLG